MNIIKTMFFLSILLTLSQGCAQIQKEEKELPQEALNDTIVLMDFFREHKKVDSILEATFRAMSPKLRIAQVLMPATGRLGKPKEQIIENIKDSIIGGVLMLNGTKDQFTLWIQEFDSLIVNTHGIPFLYSADAEPSLVNRKINGSTPVKFANQIDSIEEVDRVAKSISKDLNDIGINYNFAPVVDMSPNKTVGFRSFGKNPENIVPWSAQFIKTTQDHNILATAKHFPGHGLVSGDTHKSLQVINGSLKEIKNYPPLIEDSVLSIMVAHIAVQNNEKYSTKGLPATCSEKIVTKLLKEELGFKGLVVTDAMNMGGVISVPNHNVKAINAGCDIILMPLDAKKAHKELSDEYAKNPEFQQKIDAAAKKIIRMKICLGLIR